MFRKILISLTITILFLGFLVLNGWNLFNINAGLEKLVASRLRNAFGDACTIEGVSLGFGSLNLDGVTLAFEDAPYALYVDELRLGYSLPHLLLKGTADLERSAEEITLYRPRLILRFNPQAGDENLDLALQMPQDTEDRYRAFIREYDFINRITVSEGEIFVLNLETGEQARVANAINGYAYTDDRQRAWLRLAGHFFESSDYNMVLYGQLDLRRGGLDFLNVDLHDYQIGNEFPIFMPDYFEVMDGRVNGSLQIRERKGGGRQFDVNGDFNLSGGALKLKTENLLVEDIEIEGEVRDWNLEINHASQKVNGAPLVLTGRIENLLQPRFDLAFTSDELDLGGFLRRLFPEADLPISGHASLAVHLTETPTNPVIRGVVHSDSLVVLNQKADSAAVEFTFSERNLQLVQLTGHLAGGDLSGSGEIDFGVPQDILDLELEYNGDFTRILRNLGLPTSKLCLGEASVRVFGPLESPVSRGEFKVYAGKASEEAATLQGSFNYHDAELLVNATSADDQFSLNAKIGDLFSAPYWDVELSNFEHLFAFLDDPRLEFAHDRYHLNLRVEGRKPHLNFVLDGYRRSNFEPLFRLVSDPAASGEDLVAGKLELFPDTPRSVKGDFELELAENGAQLRHISLGNWFKGRLERSGKNEYDGEFDVSGLDVGLLFSLFQENGPDYAGQIYGRVTIAGSADAPAVSGNFWLMDGFLRGVGPLRSELTFTWNDAELEVKKLLVSTAERAHLLAQGTIDLRNETVDATISGAALNANRVIRAITGMSGVVGGTANLEVQLKGPLPNVPIYGYVKLRDAQLLRLRFDRVTWDLGTPSDGRGSYLNTKGVQIGRFQLEKEGEFVLEGSGWLPFDSNGDLDLRMQGSGNLLAMLTDIEPFFERSAGAGFLDLQVHGRYKRPKFYGSRFRYTGGMLGLSTMTDKIENLEADLEIVTDDYRLKINKLSGEIDGRRFEIANTHALDSIAGRTLEPLRVAGDDLNLGVLLLSTPEDGVLVHIPGLMEKGEAGWYALAGQQPDEPFLIAGPWQRPYVRGEIRLHNANVTFPFEEGPADDNSVIMNILYSLDWDVRAVAGKDTRYVKQFATGAYVNMEVDKENSDLHFTGVWRDSSFRIEGRVFSKRGEFEYLDQTFRVERFGAEFDRASLYPVVYGKAWTVVRDTSNVPYDVYLELYTVDELTNQEVNKGRWDRLNIKLTSAYPGYKETQGDVMAVLGFSSQTVQEQATKAVAYGTDRLLFRPIMRPLERGLERALGLDVVRFSYAITKNFLYANFNNEQLSSTLDLLRSSRLVLGKYVTDNLYLLYSGELKAGIEYRFQDKGVGLLHSFGLEYRLTPQWLLQMEYDYNTLLETNRDDKKIWLRHSFLF